MEKDTCKSATIEDIAERISNLTAGVEKVHGMARDIGNVLNGLRDAEVCETKPEPHIEGFVAVTLYQLEGIQAQLSLAEIELDLALKTLGGTSHQ